MLSIPHLIIIFVVALVVFGPEKLPELARTLGKVMAEFRRHTGDLRSTFEGHLRDIERESDNRRIAGTGAASVPYPAAEPQPPPVNPGTVPSNAPNAAAIAASTAGHSPEGLTDPASSASVSPNPDDPYMMRPGVPGEPPANSLAASDSSKSETIPEHLSHGDIYPS